MTNEYIKVEVNFFDHAKVVNLGDTALRLHLTAIAYANRLMTDGFIAEAIVRRLVDYDSLDDDARSPDGCARQLEQAVLWHRADAPCPRGHDDTCPKLSGDGWRIHDFLDGNTPREERLAKRAEDRDRKARYRDAKRKQGDRPQAVHKGHVDVSQWDSPSPSDGTARPGDAPIETTTETTTTVTTGGPNTVASPAARPVSVERLVFEAWQQATGKHRAKLDAKRRRAIQRALAAYPLDDVLDAIHGWQHDPWTERPRYNDLTVLLRDAEHVEKFRDLARHGPQPTGGNQPAWYAHAQRMYAEALAEEGGRVT